MTSTFSSNHMLTSSQTSCHSRALTKSLPATTLQESSFSECFSKALESVDASEEKADVVFVSLQDSWMKTKEQFLDMRIHPVGSLIRQDWQSVEELIRDSNRILKFASAPKCFISQECFRLLDRLCQESEVLKQRQEQYKQRQTQSYREQRDDEDTTSEVAHAPSATPYLPCDIRLLAAVVGSWSQVIRWQKKKNKNAVESIRRRKNNPNPQNQPIGNTSNTTSYTEKVLLANEVLDKVAKYASSGLFTPDRIIYTIILDAIDDDIRPLGAAWLADRVVQQMIVRAQYDPFDQFHHPNATTMLYLIQRWSQAADPRKAEEHLSKLLLWYRGTQRLDMRPTVKIYAAVITAWGNHANGKRYPGVSWTRIPELYEEMQLITSEALQDEDSLPAYNTICQAFANSREGGAAEKAHAILLDLLQSYHAGRPLKPNQATFSAVIEAYSKRGRIDQAEGVLYMMENLFCRTFDESIRPNSACYGALIWAYAAVGNTPQTEATLLRMAKVVAPGIGGSDLSSDIHCWTGVLKAWTKSGDGVTGEQTAIAVQWLEEMSKRKTADGSSASSDWSSIKNYNALVGCFAHSPNSQQGAQLAEFVLQWMEEQRGVEGTAIPLPDGKTYLACITAWRNAKNPVRAQFILYQLCDKLHQRSMGASVIDRRHFNVAMAAWSESGFPKHLSADRAHKLLDCMGSFYLTPDVVTYSTLIKAWIRSAKPALAAKKAEALLQNMKEQCLQGNTSAQPNLMTYNSVIAAVSRCPENSAPERAQGLFAEMLQSGLIPDRITYNSLMALFLRRSRPDLVEDLFRDLVQAWNNSAGDESLKPDMQAYTTLLQAWSRVGEPERTAEVLNEMITKCELGELDGRPTTRVFDAVLQAWLRSNRPDAPTQASKGLERMLALSESGRFDCRPNLYSYSTVISTYTRSRAPNAGQGALQTLQRLQALYHRTGDPKCRPSPVAYAQVMIALSFGSTLEAFRSFEQLLMEIQENDTLHWSEESVAPTFRKVARELENSHLPHKQSLMASLKQLMEHRGFFRTAEESF